MNEIVLIASEKCTKFSELLGL